MRQEEWSQWRIPSLSSGTEPTSFRFVAYCFNQLYNLVLRSLYGINIYFCLTETSPLGRDSLDCIASRYGLDGPGIECRQRRDFPRPSVQSLGQTRISFRGIKRPGRGFDKPLPSRPRLKKKMRLYSSVPSWPVIGRTLPLSFHRDSSALRQFPYFWATWLFIFTKTTLSKCVVFQNCRIYCFNLASNVKFCKLRLCLHIGAVCKCCFRYDCRDELLNSSGDAVIKHVRNSCPEVGLRHFLSV